MNLQDDDIDSNFFSDEEEDNKEEEPSKVEEQKEEELINHSGQFIIEDNHSEKSIHKEEIQTKVVTMMPPVETPQAPPLIPVVP